MGWVQFCKGRGSAVQVGAWSLLVLEIRGGLKALGTGIKVPLPEALDEVGNHPSALEIGRNK